MSSVVQELKKTNNSGIYPVDMRVVVKPETMEELSDGGIFIPADARNRQDMAHIKATIISVGAQAFEDIKNKGSRPQEGAIVSIAKYAGYLIRGKDEVEYRIINDTDVVAVLDGDFDVRTRG